MDAGTPNRCIRVGLPREHEVRGESLSPLYSSVPKAVRNDDNLYELLALVDAIRSGRARERDIAKNGIKAAIGQLWIGYKTPIWEF